MHIHEDEAAQMFSDAYSVLLERAPQAPTFDEIRLRLDDQVAAWSSMAPDRGSGSNGRGPAQTASLLVPDQPSDEATLLDTSPSNREMAVSPPVRRLALIVAAAAAIVVTVSVVAVNRDRGEQAAAPVMSPGPAGSAVPVAGAGSESSVWPLLSYEDGSGVAGVVAGGPGFVAVGRTDGHAAVWTSADGVTWSPVSHDESVFEGEGFSAVRDVTIGGPGFVAVGERDVCTDAGTLADERAPRADEDGFPSPETGCLGRRAAVWTSVDGLTWSRVPHDDAVFGGGDFAHMTNVIAAGPGLVAVGRSEGRRVVDPSGVDDAVAEADAAVWTSTDGLTWSRVPHNEDVFGGPETQEMLGIATGGPGLVAVGRDGAGLSWDNPILWRGGQNAAVWTSSDGLVWSRIELGDSALGDFRSAMIGVAEGGPGLVAVGHRDHTVAPVWTSADGVTWTMVTHADTSEMAGTMTDVAPGGPGLVAIGFFEGNDVVWTSIDGVGWSSTPDLTAARP